MVYDGVGKMTFLTDFECLRPRGMLVVYGNASGSSSFPLLVCPPVHFSVSLSTPPPHPPLSLSTPLFSPSSPLFLSIYSSLPIHPSPYPLLSLTPPSPLPPLSLPVHFRLSSCPLFSPYPLLSTCSLLSLSTSFASCTSIDQRGAEEYVTMVCRCTRPVPSQLSFKRVLLRVPPYLAALCFHARRVRQVS
mgnify:CR=1 FL=1